MSSSTDKISQQNLDSTEPENGSGDLKVGEDDECDRSDDSGVSDQSSDDHEEIDKSVMEEMANLEQIFDDKGLRFRFVDRIGEGIALTKNFIYSGVEI